MPKKHQMAKKELRSFFSLFIILLILFFNRANVVLGAENSWIEVSKTPLGLQYLDTNSLDSKGNGVIEITTKYLKLEANTTKEIEDNIYIMKINCITNEFKDISINGKTNLYAKWEAPNGDKLLNDVISYSCKNV
tara:strand:+ start:62 stop:466 length:405 start_codon:yes stop_codon:yes gene_type:complete